MYAKTEVAHWRNRYETDSFQMATEYGNLTEAFGSEKTTFLQL